MRDSQILTVDIGLRARRAAPIHLLFRGSLGGKNVSTFRIVLLQRLIPFALLSGWVFSLGCRRSGTATDLHDSPGNEAAMTPPLARFVDVTDSSGIQFVHHSGAYGAKLLPESMGTGVAFFDFDSDGLPDVLLVNTTGWPGHPLPLVHSTLASLYHNESEGRFRDVTDHSGLDVNGYGVGVAVGDYDNDGRPDVLITLVGGARLFHNEGSGKFIDVTIAAGVGGSASDWSTSAAWLDYDNDGRLDLFVCNYVQWSAELDAKIHYQIPGLGRAFGPPKDFEGTFPHLYHNEGGGRFKDVSAVSGVQVTHRITGKPLAKSLALAPVDIDNDGWIDWVVANDTVQNFVFRNQHNGTFREMGEVSSIAFDSQGQVRGAMGIDSARFRNDDSLAIAIGNFANEMNALYVAQRDPLVFADEALVRGFGPASRSLLKFGLFFFDYDLDGRLDVLTANGHLEPDIAKVQPGQQYRQPAQLFWNGGPRNGNRFMPVVEGLSGSDLVRPMVGRGSAYADIDGDGDLDVILTQVDGPPRLLRNDQTLGHHWLRLTLQGTRSNRDAIGASVTLRLAGQKLSRQVMPTRSYLSQSELTLTFGLGSQLHYDAIEITWPGGERQFLPGGIADRRMTIQQPP